MYLQTTIFNILTSFNYQLLELNICNLYIILMRFGLL